MRSWVQAGMRKFNKKKKKKGNEKSNAPNIYGLINVTQLWEHATLRFSTSVLNYYCVTKHNLLHPYVQLILETVVSCKRVSFK